MKQTPQSNVQKNIIKAALNEVSLNSVQIAQCASLSSLFISGSFISATINQLAEELVKRHKGMIDMESVMENAQEAINFGVENELFEKEGNKYTPTETGWFFGTDWERKLRFGWDA